MSEQAKCELCGEPMPKGEEMFKFHGYSCECPKPPLQKTTRLDRAKAALAASAEPEPLGPCICPPGHVGHMDACPAGYMKIVIKKSPTADTRTCDFTKVSKETLLNSSHQHIEDVRAAMRYFQLVLARAAEVHDYDKIMDIEGFHRDFVTGFKRTEWWDAHRKLNRHHLQQADGIRDDVNLIDVLDFIADCVMAGMARSGSIYSLKLSPELLEKAFQNTVELLKGQVEVADGDSKS